MCLIEDFGHPLEIAFSLSAVFYYVEMRATADERVRAALATHEAAERTAQREYRGVLRDTLKTEITRETVLGLPRRAIPFLTSNALRRELASMTALVLLPASRRMVMASRYLTPVFAFLSTAFSLGPLLFAGFQPHYEIDGRWMALILFVAYLSILWNIAIYAIYIPRLAQTIDSLNQTLGTQSKATQQNDADRPN